MSGRRVPPAEAALVDGLLLHHELVGAAVAVCPPAAVTSAPHRDAYRALVAAWQAGELAGPLPAGGAYVVVAGRLERPRDVLGLGWAGGRLVDTRDPLAAAAVVAEAHYRRNLAAEMVRCATAVARGVDPDVVLTRLVGATR